MPRPVYLVHVRAEPGVAAVRSLRGWLKAGLRHFGLRCVGAIEEQTNKEITMPYDLNTAEKEGGSTIPPNLYWLMAKVKPGGAGDDYMLRRSKNHCLEMLELELTVVGGPYAGQRFWEMISLNYVEGSCADQAQVDRYKKRRYGWG
jgi:hypothetical protein